MSFGSLLAWREGAMHQRSSNKKCQTIIEGTELRRDELKLSIVAQFYSTCVPHGPSAIVGDVYTHGQSYFTLSSPAELDSKTRGKNLGF